MVIRVLPGLEYFMEALLVSTGVVALAEIGDKTQLLAFILAARFKNPCPSSQASYARPSSITASLVLSARG